MNNPFVIEFDFPLEHTAIKIHLQAVAEPIEPFSYLVHSFRPSPGPVDGACLLPDQKIQYIDRGDYKSWVYLDSKKEADLSLVIGKAIEKQIGEMH